MILANTNIDEMCRMYLNQVSESELAAYYKSSALSSIGGHPIDNVLIKA